MKVKIKNIQGFKNVFGADCFLANWPELLTTGVKVVYFKLQGWYYIYDSETDWIAHDTAFFTKEDMKYLTVVRKRDSKGRFIKESE